MNTCCGYLLEVPHWGTSNKYPQHIFSCRNMSWVLIRSASTKKVDGRTDRQTDGRMDRSKMTHIRAWPRSYPDKHSGQVWKFSVAKYSSYPSIKKVWTDKWTDGPQMTHIQTFNSQLPEKNSSYCSTKKMWMDRRTDRQMMW